MARIKIDLPQGFNFSTKIKIRITDINYGGHVGNDSILSIMHEARLQYLKSLGFKDEVSIDKNTGLIITDAAVVYKAESFHGDCIEVKITVEDFSKYGFDMLYLLTRDDNGKEIARGKTGIICFDYMTRKVSGIPENLIIKIRG